MTMKRIFLAAFVIGFAVVANSVHGQGWGDLTATFKVEGTAPAAKPISPNKDVEFCGKHKLVDEALVVNAENGGIANVIVSIYVARGGKKPAIHESYKALEKEPVVLDNVNCRFEPHVAALWTARTLIAGNKDSIGHNTNVTTLKNPAQNILIPAGGQVKMPLTMEELLPATVACNIHPWMKGYVVVKEHPYIGISDKDGKLSIKNIPVGKWTFQFWQEAAGYLADVKRDGKAAKWERGRLEVDVKAGANDLGEIKIATSAFKL